MNAMAVNWDKMITTGELPEGVQLFREEKVFDILGSETVMVENKTGEKVKRLRLTGVFQKADSFNENNRRYSYDIITEALKAIQEAVKLRRVLGELDHAVDAKIHLDRASHLVTKLWMDDKKVYGELEILEDMPCGKMLKTLVDANVCIGISSRGVGDMSPISLDESAERFDVLPGFRFITWDVVAEPSVTEAQLSVLESKQYNLVNDTHRRKIAEEQLLKEIRQVLGKS